HNPRPPTISPPQASTSPSYRPRPPPRSPLFPYTTLFRSAAPAAPAAAGVAAPGSPRRGSRRDNSRREPTPPGVATARAPARRGRSEEHTSELQSRENLVCRLLLEKKTPPMRTLFIHELRR